MPGETLDKIRADLDLVKTERTGAAVDYSPYIKIALRLFIFWLRRQILT